MMLSVQSWYLRCTEGTSDKFYEVHLIEDGQLVLRWGRFLSNGSMSSDKLSFDDAHAVALRQVYTKAAKGYRILHDCFRWECEADVPLDRIHIAFKRALDNPQFSGERAIVNKHYTNFITECERLMNDAVERSFEDVLPEFNRLQKQFEAIEEMHQRAKGTMDMTNAMLMQKLMG